MDVDGVEDNGTARDVLVDAEIKGTVRFGGRGEFFVPCDLRRKSTSEKRPTKSPRDDVRMWLIERAARKSSVYSKRSQKHMTEKKVEEKRCGWRNCERAEAVLCGGRKNPE